MHRGSAVAKVTYLYFGRVLQVEWRRWLTIEKLWSHCCCWQCLSLWLDADVHLNRALVAAGTVWVWSASILQAGIVAQGCTCTCLIPSLNALTCLASSRWCWLYRCEVLTLVKQRLDCIALFAVAPMFLKIGCPIYLAVCWSKSDKYSNTATPQCH